MSDFRAYWRRLCRKTPALEHEDATIKMTIAEFRRHVEKAYHQGWAHRGSETLDVFDSFNRIFRRG